MTIVLSYGLDPDDERAAVRATIEARGSLAAAALDYTEANPDASLDEIKSAIRACIGAERARP